MRVLFAVRDDLEREPGGDTVQTLGTALALRQLGVDVVISSDLKSPADHFDLIHLWHLERVHESYAHLLRAETAGVPAVLSPIYWSEHQKGSARLTRARHWPEEAKNLVRFLRARSWTERAGANVALRTGWGRCRRRLLESTVALLPNSHAEAALLADETTRPIRLRVVPNAFDVDNLDAAATGRHLPTNGVACVGHFDPRKNQLALIEALRETDIPVTFVGGARRMHRAYYRKCQQRLGAHMSMLGPLPAEEVASVLRRVKAHVCPSWFETPGLANLEAAALGCALVIGDCPPVREYFGNSAHYVDPADPSSLRRAIHAALAQAPDQALSQRVRTQFTFAAAAKATLHVYEEVLAERTARIAA